MILELKPEQEQILEMATRSGMSREEVLDQAFEIIRAQHELDDWIAANRHQITAQIGRSIAEAERGELIPDHEIPRLLQDRRNKRNIA